MDEERGETVKKRETYRKERLREILNTPPIKLNARYRLYFSSVIVTGKTAMGVDYIVKMQ